MDDLTHDLDQVSDIDRFGSTPAAVGVTSLWFADDAAILAKNQKDLQKLLDVCAAHAVQNHYEFSASKSAILHCHSAGNIPPPTPINHYILDEKIPVVDNFTYLGIPFNRFGIDTSALASRVRSKAITSANLLTSIGMTMRNIDPISTIHLLKSVCISQLTFGIQFLPASGRSLCYQTLERGFSYCATRLLRINYTSSRNGLHFLANFPSFHQTSKITRQEFQVKINLLHHYHPETGANATSLWYATADETPLSTPKPKTFRKQMILSLNNKKPIISRMFHWNDSIALHTGKRLPGRDLSSLANTEARTQLSNKISLELPHILHKTIRYFWLWKINNFNRSLSKCPFGCKANEFTAGNCTQHHMAKCLFRRHPPIKQKLLTLLPRTALQALDKYPPKTTILDLAITHIFLVKPSKQTASDWLKLVEHLVIILDTLMSEYIKQNKRQ